jgi:hypothetical protein
MPLEIESSRPTVTRVEPQICRGLRRWERRRTHSLTRANRCAALPRITLNRAPHWTKKPTHAPNRGFALRRQAKQHLCRLHQNIKRRSPGARQGRAYRGVLSLSFCATPAIHGHSLNSVTRSPVNSQHPGPDGGTCPFRILTCNTVTVIVMKKTAWQSCFNT